MHIRQSLSRRAESSGSQPISELMSRALASPDLISLAAGFVDQTTLPVEPTRRAFDALFRDPAEARAALQYGTTPGYPPLRDELLRRFLESDFGGKAELSLEQVVITAGSNQLLHLVGESLLDPGDLVLCAAPTYLVFLGTLNNIGARSVGVATDLDGIIPESLEEQLSRLKAAGDLPRVKAIYVVSFFDNPRGVTMSLPRRTAIVEIARRWSTASHRIHVIEDVAYRDLRYRGEDTPSMRTVDPDGETVVVAGTFSKSFSPGIRIGWGFLPRHLVAPVCNQKGNIDFGSPNFSQHLMAKVLQLGEFESHLVQIQQGYRQKLDAMLDAAAQYLAPLDGVRWIEPAGGLYVWVTLPESMDTGPAGPLFDIAVERGVLYVPGQYCFPVEGEPVHRNTIRLSFGVQSCDKIRQGIRSLAEAIEQAQVLTG